MSPPEPTPPLLSLHGVDKSFGAVQALRDARLDLYAGEAHGLVGENGAGKSTLVRVLSGAHRPDTGQLTMDGQPLVLHGPADARAAGIAVIYQEPTLFPDLSVEENVVMGYHPLGSLRRIDRGAVDEHLAVVAPDHAAEDLDQRRLAGAVLAHERADLTGAQRDVAVVQRADRAVRLRHATQLDDRAVNR